MTHLDENDRPTTDELEAMPVLAQGQADDLHYEDGETQFWLSRTGIADGEPYENTVTIQAKDPRTGRWEEVLVYDGDNPTDSMVRNLPEED